MSTLGDKEFIYWLIDEIWNDELWEYNKDAFPEIACRKLVKAGYLRLNQNREYEIIEKL